MSLLCAVVQVKADDAVEHTNTVEISRYAKVKAESTTEQRNLLSVVVKLHFPKTVTKVSDSLEYSLLRSGYMLDLNNSDKEVIEILQQQTLP